MKNRAPYILIILFSFLLNSCDGGETVTIVSTHSDGSKKVEEFLAKDGSIRQVHYYIGGVKMAKEIHMAKDRANNGLYEEWTPGGLLILEGNYEQEEKEGIWRKWYDNGQMMWEGAYDSKLMKSLEGEERQSSNTRVGEWRRWHQNGQLAELRHHDAEGKGQGLNEVWYASGQKHFEMEFKGGLRNGLTLEFFDNGKLRMETSYVSGHENGSYKIYHVGGQVQESGQKVNDKREGEIVTYSPGGQVVSRQEYHLGLVQ